MPEFILESKGPYDWVATGIRKDELIRCKDCKHYEPDIYANPWGTCCHREWIVNDTGHEVDENGYCYRAERRKNEK